MIRKHKDKKDLEEASQDEEILTEEECNLLCETREENQRTLEEIMSMSEGECEHYPEDSSLY